MVQPLSLFLVLAENDAFLDKDEGEAFDFDSGDDIPEADHPPPEAPASICWDKSLDSVKADHVLLSPDLPEPSTSSNTAGSVADSTATSRPSAAGGATAEEVPSATEGCEEGFLPPPPTVISDSKQTGL